MCKALEAASAFVDVERACPDLSRTNEKGHVEDAIMDLVVRWPGLRAETRIDVSVRSVHAARYDGSATRVGRAA
eukprot:5346368-Alexandrium_andersonii.AAC.1